MIAPLLTTWLLVAVALTTGHPLDQLQVEDGGTCPESPNYFFIQKHIRAGRSATMAIDFNSSSIVRINCISGVIWDLASGYPSFNITLEALTPTPTVFPLLNAVSGSNNTNGVRWCSSSWCINAAINFQYTTLPGPPVQWQIRFTNNNMLWNANVNLTFSIEEYNVGPAPPPSNGCTQGCTPNGTRAVSGCEWYLNSPNASWLPRNYAQAAYCACTLNDSPVGLHPTAQCVRAHLYKFHVEDHYFSAAVKAQAAQLKDSLCYGGPHNDQWCFPTYYAPGLSGLSFGSIAHQLHQDAYDACCCPHRVAPLAAWWGVIIGGWAVSAVCPIEVALIETVGSCGCEGW